MLCHKKSCQLCNFAEDGSLYGAAALLLDGVRENCPLCVSRLVTCVVSQAGGFKNVPVWLKTSHPHFNLSCRSLSTPFSLDAPPHAVVDLLVKRELLWSEARSVTFSFMHDCFSSINISAGRHQQHRLD
ncbi:hypothetical protein EYF80_027245 [Liparis tanakae]|uniref:Uncharacterized protein n=1 Tax=Liparis tanakae TaxID=230148 RepID=A0A4Z2HCN7_9TELE|nr:hypothetical protein EYF80_027245 [Liparis tanakae]